MEKVSELLFVAESSNVVGAGQDGAATVELWAWVALNILAQLNAKCHRRLAVSCVPER